VRFRSLGAGKASRNLTYGTLGLSVHIRCEKVNDNLLTWLSIYTGIRTRSTKSSCQHTFGSCSIGGTFYCGVVIWEFGLSEEAFRPGGPLLLRTNGTLSESACWRAGSVCIQFHRESQQLTMGESTLPGLLLMLCCVLRWRNAVLRVERVG